MESKSFFFRASNVFFFFRGGIASKFVCVLWISTCWIYHPHREINRAKWRFTGIPDNEKDIMSPQDFAWKNPSFFKVFSSPRSFGDEYGCFRKRRYLQIIHFNSVFHYKPSILGYHYFWKHPYRDIVPHGTPPIRSDLNSGSSKCLDGFFFQTPPGPVSVAGNVGVYRVLYLYTLR